MTDGASERKMERVPALSLTLAMLKVMLMEMLKIMKRKERDRKGGERREGSYLHGASRGHLQGGVAASEDSVGEMESLDPCCAT